MKEIAEFITEDSVIFEDKFDYWLELIGFRYIQLLQFIYSQSICDLDNLYKSIAMLTYKTHNSQKDLEKMSYWKFQNLLVYINEILEQENGGKNSSEGQDGPNEQFNNMQASAKSMMKNTSNNFKMPSMPKIPKM